MVSHASLPHLFGRFTAVMNGHRDLAQTLLEVRRLCANIEDTRALPPDQASPDALMQQLRSNLAEHFAVEEGDGYFGALVDEAPALAGQVDELKAEHELMLRIAAMLCVVALDSSRWPELPRATRELLVVIERHERAESALLGVVLSVRAD